MKTKTSFILLLAIIPFLRPFHSAGQYRLGRPGQQIRLEPEMQNDAYRPNAHRGTKVSPAYRYEHPGSAVLLNSSIYTYQVNVDAGGQNILGDAGNEPNIAVNPLNPGEIVIGWRQFDNVGSNFRQAGWSFTTDGGQHWTFPGVIEPGIFRSDPVLDYDLSGKFYYNSLTSSFACKVFQSTDGGSTWNSGTDAGGGDKQWMAIDRTAGVGTGNIYSFWSSYYSTCPPGFFTRSSDGGASYESCTVVDGDPSLGTMAVGPNGELYIAGNDSLGNIVVAKSTNAQIPGSTISWDLPSFANLDGYVNGGSINPAGLLGQVNIDVDRSTGAGQGNVYVLASVTRLSNNDPGDVMFVRSTDGGQTWDFPVQVNDDASIFNTQWFGSMSVAPNGRIDAIWLDTRDNPGSDESALYYSYSSDGGVTWSANEKLSASFDPHIGYPNQNKMGDYFDMISDDTGAHLAWANTLNGEQDVYYSHIVPPNTTGTTALAGNTAFTVFPNPSTGKLTLRGELNSATAELFTVMGSKLISTSLSGTRSALDLTTQPSGVYILKITYPDKHQEIRRIIRE